MTNCECPVAGYCARHSVEKTGHLLHLCRTRQDFFDAWESGRGPGQIKPEYTATRKRLKRKDIDLKKLGRKLWKNLVETVHTLEALPEWEDSIPSYGCDCSSFYKAWKRENPPRLDNGLLCFRWKWELRSAVNEKLSHSNLTFEEAVYKYRYEHRSSQVNFLTTYEELSRDAVSLAELIYKDHPDITGVAGVPRSGMLVAPVIAVHLGIDLYECPSDGSPIRKLNGGLRQSDGELHGERLKRAGRKIVIVDDSSCSGFAVNQLSHHKLPFYVVYAGNHGKTIVDGYAVPMDLPHLFEWNMMHNGNLMTGMNAAFDMDGVFCRDCPLECDDDGPRYEHWMRTVRPLQWSTEFEIPLIVTARREKYRQQTVEWLLNHRIRVKELVMFPGTFEERSKTDIGGWKATIAMERGCKLFVESSLEQANRIATVYPNCMVVSIERPK